MGNCIMAFPNRVDQATLSGGDWQAPVANLKTRLLTQVARSSNTGLASTKVNIDLGKDRGITVLALIKHNLSTSARYRITAGTASGGGDLYDSGWLAVWPEMFPWETLEWEQDNWWEGTISEEERYGYPAAIIHLLPAITAARYWTLEIDDQNNPAGYIEAGRLFVSEKWQPAVNMSWGAALGFETKTGVDESLGGSEFFDKRSPYRVSKLKFDWLGRDEAYAKALEMQRLLGVDGEVLLVQDPDDAVHRIRHSYLGRMRSLGSIDHTSPGRYGVQIEIKEIV